MRTKGKGGQLYLDSSLPGKSLSRGIFRCILMRTNGKGEQLYLDSSLPGKSFIKLSSNHGQSQFLINSLSDKILTSISSQKKLHHITPFNHRSNLVPLEHQLFQESPNFKKHIGELLIRYTIENDQKRKFIPEEIQ